MLVSLQHCSILLPAEGTAPNCLLCHMKEQPPGSNAVWGHHQHKADVPRAPDYVGVPRAAGTSPLPPGHCPPLLGQVRGAQLLPDPSGSVAGPRRSCWSWLALPKASSSIFALPAQLVLTWRGKCSALFRWIPGSRGGFAGSAWPFQQGLGSTPEPLVGH